MNKLNDHVKDVCQIGKADKCCRYLMATGDGFECAKQTNLKTLIDRRVEANTYVAKGDNCYGIIGVIPDLIKIPVQKCFGCGKKPRHKHWYVPTSEYLAYVGGELIQIALKSMTDCEREAIKTGLCGKCWDEITKFEEE